MKNSIVIVRTDLWLVVRHQPVTPLERPDVAGLALTVLSLGAPGGLGTRDSFFEVDNHTGLDSYNHDFIFSAAPRHIGIVVRGAILGEISGLALVNLLQYPGVLKLDAATTERDRPLTLEFLQ